MNTDPTKPLLTFLMLISGILYLGGIMTAGIVSIQGGSEIPNILLTAITIIGGILATNLGAVVGISYAIPAAKTNLSNIHPRYLGLRPTTTAQKSRLPSPTQTASTNQKFQILACYFYVAALIIAAIFWIIIELQDKKNPVPVLEELAKTLLGVIAGALSVSLTK